MVSEAIAKGDVQAINYFVAQKYVEALGKIASADNQKVLMLPMESSSLIGALAVLAKFPRKCSAKAMDGSKPHPVQHASGTIVRRRVAEQVPPSEAILCNLGANPANSYDGQLEEALK